MEIDLSINPEVVRKTLKEFIHAEITRAGFSRAVVNISGGLDSAVAFLMAVEAMGAENVLAIRAPYRTSSADSLTHAQMLINRTGSHSITIPITEMVDDLVAMDPGMSAIRKGNIMARMRMIVAYDQSEAFHGLVVGSGNKTEILLGYTTLYGDSACAINPIGDLYKTQVRQLGRALAVPEEILSKAPSADLWPGQTDEGELGFTYTDVDKLLYLLVDRHYRPEECVKAGFKEDFVDLVLERMKRNQFKRVLPPIARLTQRT